MNAASKAPYRFHIKICFSVKIPTNLTTHDSNTRVTTKTFS